jgi:hypothetical protein
MTGLTSAWADQQTELAATLGWVLPNEFLFMVFYVASFWKRPISSSKLAKDLGSSENIVRDHLNLLVKLGLFLKHGEKYRPSELGNQAFLFVRQSVQIDQVLTATSIGPVNVSNIGLGVMSAASEQKSFRLEITHSELTDGFLPKEQPVAVSNTIFREDSVAENAA